jgi:AMIN domain
MLKSALKTTAVSMVILSAIVLMAQCRRSTEPGPSDALPLVREISINNDQDGTVVIDVGLTQLVPYRTFQLSGPKRLVVDLKGALRALPKGVYPAQSQLLERVRVGQWQRDPAIVRVVADLKGTPAFSVNRQASGIRIELKPRSSGDRPASGSRADRPQSARNGDEDRAKTAPRMLAEKSPFTVHRFKDLSASLTAPELPAQDQLVPVTKADLSGSGREESATPAEVSGISIKPESGGETLVDIASTRSVPYRVFQLADPFRLVVDLKGAHNAARQDVYPVDSSVLKRIRVGQWRPGDPAVVRVVADLEGYPIFDVHAEQPGIRIELRPRRELGPLIRNPFEFATPQHNQQLERAAAQSNQAMTAATNSPTATPGNSFSGLKVIGFVEQKDSAIQAVISDRASIYFVPNGGTFENTFRVIAISPNAVQIQNVETLDTSWLAYTP